MVCLSGRELRNTTPNFLIMFVLNTNFADPNNPTGYPSRKSVSKSGATCFETVDDLGGADGLAGNNLETRSQDSVTNFGIIEDGLDPQFARWGGPMIETELNSEIAHWREHVDVLRQYKPGNDELVEELLGITTSYMRKDADRNPDIASQESSLDEQQENLTKLHGNRVELNGAMYYKTYYYQNPDRVRYCAHINKNDELGPFGEYKCLNASEMEAANVI